MLPLKIFFWEISFSRPLNVYQSFQYCWGGPSEEGACEWVMDVSMLIMSLFSLMSYLFSILIFLSVAIDEIPQIMFLLFGRFFASDSVAPGEWFEED